MQSLLIYSLIFLPTLAAPVSYLIGRRSKPGRDNFVALITGIEFFLAILLALHSGTTAEIPGVFGFGLHFEADGFRCIMAFLAALGWFESTLMLREYFDHSRNRNRYYVFWLLTLTGTMGVFLSTDLLTTFVFFEVMSFASWVMVIHTEKDDALRAAETYLAVAVIGGLVTLMGIFLLYHMLGTVTFDAMYEAVQTVENRGALYLAGGLTLVGFAAKAGVFPLHIWLPTAHPAAPAPASAVLSGVIIKSGVFGILVLSTRVFRYDFAWGMVMLALGVITMLLGAVLAVFSTDLKRTLACSSVSQIGFILVGVAMQCLLGEHNALAVDGTLLHIVNHASVKLILFPAAGVIYCTSHTFDLTELRGFGKNKPLLALIMAIPMASLAGVPGLNGYVSKTLLHESIVEYIHLMPQTAGLFTAVEWLFLLAGGLTTAYMLKLFVCLFVQSPGNPRWAEPDPYASRLSLWTLLSLVWVMPVLGLLPNLLMDGLAAFGRGFMLGHAPGHAVHYFAWVNLKGGLISLLMGALIYGLLIRRLLMKKTALGPEYPDRWPAGFSLENVVFRPLFEDVLPLLGLLPALLAELIVDAAYVLLPLLGATVARALESLVDGTVRLGSNLIYFRQTRDIAPPEDAEFAAYKAHPQPRVGFRFSFAYSLMLMGLGLALTVLFVLLRG